MLYVMMASNVKDSLEKIKAGWLDHIERLNILKNEGRLILTGLYPAIDNNEPGKAGFTGLLLVAEFDCLEEAQTWADVDPYLASGVYEHVVVKPFKKVLP